MRRAGRRKSPWNLLLFPIGFGLFAVTWFAFFQLVWRYHAHLYPAHEFKDFWPRGVRFRSFVPSFLMLFAPAPAALLLALLATNALLWLSRPLRRTFEAEAQEFPEAQFRNTMKSLLLTAAWVLPLGFTVALMAAASLKSLR